MPLEITHVSDSIQAQIRRVPHLSPNGQIFQHRIHTLRIRRNGRCFEMFDILTDAERLSSEAKLLLDDLKGGNYSSGIVRAIEVPGVEAREVLKRAEKLVATDCKGRSELV